MGLLDKLKNKHFLSLAGNGFLAVFGLLTMKTIYHFMTLSDAGLYMYFLLILSLSDSLRNGMLSTATVKFYAGLDPEKEEGKGVLGAVWFLAIAITLLYLVADGILILAFAGSAKTELHYYLNWLGITFLSSLPFSVIYWKLQAEENYSSLLWLRLVNSLSTISAFLVLAYFKNFNLETAFLYNFLTNCLTSAVGLLLGMSKIKTVFSYSKAKAKEIFHFGKFSLSSSFLSTMVGSVDGFIIKGLLGNEAFAIFQLPVKIMTIFDIPLRSFVATGLSSMAAALNLGTIADVKKIMLKYAGMLTMAFVPVVAIGILGNKLAIIMLGGYKMLDTSASFILIFMLCYSLIAPIDRFNGVTLDVIHKPKYNFYKVIVMLTANTIGDFVALYLFNDVRAIVIGLFASYLSAILYGYWVLNRFMSYTFVEILRVGYADTKELVAGFLNKKGN